MRDQITTPKQARAFTARLSRLAPKMLAALEQIRDLTERRQLPLTTEINDIAREAIATLTHPAPDASEAGAMKINL